MSTVHVNIHKAQSGWAGFIEKLMNMTDLAEKDRHLIPRNIHLDEKHSSLTIAYSWFKLKYLFAIVIAPFCSYVLINSEQVAGSFNDITFSVIAIIVVNFAVVYYSLAKLMNTTHISVDHNQIKIQHGPMPLLRNLTINREDLSQLYVTKHQKSHRYYLYSTSYQVNAILKNDHVIKLVGGLYEAEQGRFIEQKIEQFLGITDIAVEGEIEK